MSDTGPDASEVCRMTASVTSLAGTSTGHLMCDRFATHVTKSPGQIAYETYFAQLHGADVEPNRWDEVLGSARMAWEAAAAAVLATQHYDETDRITWMHGKVPGNGQAH